MRKDDLIEAAEASGLSSKPIRGAGAAPGWAGGRGGGRGGAHNYSGWSSMSAMCNRDPPLVQKFSNPSKYRLTPEVMYCNVMYLLVNSGQQMPFHHQGRHVAERLYITSIQTQQLAESIPADLAAAHTDLIQAYETGPPSQPPSQPARQLQASPVASVPHYVVSLDDFDADGILHMGPLPCSQASTVAAAPRLPPNRPPEPPRGSQGAREPLTAAPSCSTATGNAVALAGMYHARRASHTISTMRVCVYAFIHTQGLLHWTCRPLDHGAWQPSNAWLVVFSAAVPCASPRWNRGRPLAPATRWCCASTLGSS